MLGIVALNLGGPDSLEAVEPFLRNLFGDPEVIRLGWARPIQPLFARLVARRRAPESRKAYQQIGGRSPILAESLAQATAVVAALAARGINARPYVAMSAWHPLARETARAMKADGIDRAVALPLFPQYSETTTGGSLRLLATALASTGIELAAVERYPDAPGFITALCQRIEEARGRLPEGMRAHAPVLFSAHGLPASYVEAGDPYLDEIRITVEAVRRQANLGHHAHLAFQSRVGRAKWLGPYTEVALDRLAAEGHRAVIVSPIAFTGEHLETLQEIDILYRQRAITHGIEHFARAATVGCHPAFIDALATLAAGAAKARDWA